MKEAPKTMPELRPDEDLSVLFDFGFAQSKTGYRFGIDALLLAYHITNGPAKCLAPECKMMEIGTGSGVVSILSVAWGFLGKITAIELQEQLADRAKRNVQAASMGSQITVITADATTMADDQTRYDRIISNPPFHPKGQGRLNPNSEKMLSRHESTLTMRSLFALASQRLTPTGILSVLYPYKRLEEARSQATKTNLKIQGITPCSHNEAQPPTILILDLVQAHNQTTNETWYPQTSMNRASFPKLNQ